MSQSAVVIPFPTRRRVRRSKAAALFTPFRELEEQNLANARLLCVCALAALAGLIGLQFLG